MLEFWLGEGQGTVEPCLQVADQPGNCVPAGIRMQVDAHPVLTHVYAQALAHVQVLSAYLSGHGSMINGNALS
jgi:hypothetical protein